MNSLPAYREALGVARSSIASSCMFAFNSNVDFVASPTLAAAERFLRRKIINGGEFELDAETARRMATVFKWKEMRMGGQAGNMANAAAALGVKGLAHAYNLSPRQKGLFAKGVEAIGAKTKEESRHYVLELELRNGRRDRVIASHDPAHYKLMVSREFEARSRKFVEAGCSRAMLGGFHIVTWGRARERLGAVARLIRAWKERNPELRIHFEAGDFAKKGVLLDTVKIILPLADSIGLNEQELFEFAKVFEIPKRHEFEAARLLAEKVPEVIVHTADYAFGYSRIREKHALKYALCFGHSLSAYRAETGKYAKFSDVSRMLSGKRAACTKGSLAAKEFEKAGFGKHGVLVPSLAIKPKITVGLGDSFAAGCFLVG